MKHLILMFLSCLLSYSQSNDAVVTKKATNSFNFLKNQMSSHLKQPTFKYKFKENDFELFSIYNRNSKLNDFYYVGKDTMNYVKSYQVNFSPFMQIDSFDPNGVGSFDGGLLIGTMNMLINNVFKAGKGGIKIFKPLFQTLQNCKAHLLYQKLEIL